MATEKSTSKGQAWFCTTGLPSDIVVEVNDMSFHLHKFPLMAKSRKLHQLITELETSNLTIKRRSSDSEAEEAGDEKDVDEQQDDDDGGTEAESLHICLPEFLGGSETFETAAKFCYGVKIELSSSNVAPLRCAGEYLEMTEEYSEDNLISKTERFLSQFVLKNIKESIKTLKSCESLMPLAESLGIPQRCIDSIASKASSTDPSLFGWPVNDGIGEASRISNQILWNGIDTGISRKNVTRSGTTDSWFEDLALLSLPLYKQILTAMKAKGINSEIIESSLISYARKSIPGLSRASRKQSSASIASEAEQRELLETIITNLPLEKSSSSRSRSSTTIRHLFGLLRTANILNASEACRASLEKKIASQLELATLDDLLIPSYSYLIETLYDVDCVQRILRSFLEGLEERSEVGMEEEDEDGGGGGGERSPAINPVMLVGKLIDGYLSEIASDANLKPEKFCELAVALPDQARLFDDGLYRAVDVYLKAHPWISEEEREKICGVMDCQKLTLEACTHAAQNERLPLRAVVQVLFFEQLQLRHAIAGSLMAADLAPSERPSLLPLPAPPPEQQGQEHEQEQQQQRVEENVETVGQVEDYRTWRAAIRENQVLRLDMDSMRSRVQELERECSSMKKAIEKIDKSAGGAPGGGGGGGGGSGGRGWKTSLTKKFGCKFKTQVCDSHERTVVEARKSGKHQRQHGS